MHIKNGNVLYCRFQNRFVVDDRRKTGLYGKHLEWMEIDEYNNGANLFDLLSLSEKTLHIQPNLCQIENASINITHRTLELQSVAKWILYFWVILCQHLVYGLMPFKLGSFF